MTAPEKRHPLPVDPGRDPDDVPGYAEPQPRDRRDAQRPEPRRRRDPDEGGLDRGTGDGTTDPAGD